MTELTLNEEPVRALGFVGLGVMGEPMCANLARGTTVRVYAHDTRDTPLVALSKLGVMACGSSSDVGRHADIVFVCLANGEQLREACFGEDGLLSGQRNVRAIVDCSTTSVALTREFAEHARAEGVDWIDAPIARGREAAQSGNLSFMVGASAERFAELKPLLQCMGTDVTLCGETGAGQVVKILNNKVMIQTVHALAEALAIARAANVDGTLLFDVLSRGSADSQVLRYQGIRFMLPGDFPHAAFPTTYAHKDVGLAVDLANQVGVNSSYAQLTADLLGRAIEAGHDLDYYPIIVKLLEVRP